MTSASASRPCSKVARSTDRRTIRVGRTIDACAAVEPSVTSSYSPIVSEPSDKLFEEAMALPREQLESLVERLVAALPRKVSPGEFEEEWAAEALDRAEAYERGDLTAVDAYEALAALRARRGWLAGAARQPVHRQ